jgi:hypothetical protein
MTGDVRPYVTGPHERQTVQSLQRRTDDEVHEYYNAISTKQTGKKHILTPELTIKNVMDHVERGTWQRLPPLKETFEKHPTLFGSFRRKYWQRRQRIANAVKVNINHNNNNQYIFTKTITQKNNTL